MPDIEALSVPNYRIIIKSPDPSITTDLEHGVQEDVAPRLHVVVGKWRAGLPDQAWDAENRVLVSIKASELNQEWKQLFEQSVDPARSVSSTNQAIGTAASAPETTLIDNEVHVQRYFWYRQGGMRWTTVNSGKIRSVWQHGDVITISARREPTGAELPFLGEARSIGLSLVTLAIFLLWLIEWWRYEPNAPGFEIIKAFAVHSESARMAGAAVFFYLIAHHFRMYFGAEFTTSDESFGIAKNVVPEPERAEKRWVGSLLISTIVASSALLPPLVAAETSLPVIGILIVQFTCARIYLSLFDKEFKNWDQDRRTNKLLSFNDFTFLVTILAIVLVIGLYHVDPASYRIGVGARSFIISTRSALFAARHVAFGFFVAYVAVLLIGEFSSYAQSLRSSLKEFLNALRAAKALVWSKRPRLLRQK